MQCNNYAQLFKVLADETRVKIVQILTVEKICACQILQKLEIGQPTLSHHMRILRNSGLVSAEKVGSKIFYWLNNDSIDQFRVFFDKIGTRQKPCLENGK